MQTLEVSKDGFLISTDKSKLDIAALHEFLSKEAYWSLGVPIEIIRKTTENALNFGLYEGEKQIGYAKVISDFATIAYLGDVYVLPEYRGRGLSKWLMEIIIAHPRLQGFRRWVLSTKDAHGLYERFGFIKLHRPERWMERPDPNMKESPDYWR